MIVDDHLIVRQGIRTLLEDVVGIEVVSEAIDGQDALAQVDELKPDVVLMDVIMPGMDGAEATRRILESYPGVRVLVLTGTQADNRILGAIQAGALGYLSKSARKEDFIATIQRVHAGVPSLPPEITRQLLGQFRNPPTANQTEELTPREEEILRLVARGLSNQQIGSRIHISEATVRTHVSHILAKLELSNRVEAALWALRQGLIHLDETEALADS